MGRHQSLASILLSALLAYGSAGPALAADVNEHISYKIAWNNIAIGRIRYDAEDGSFGYHSDVASSSKGVAELFTPFRTSNEVKGTKNNGEFLPKTYISHDSKDKKCSDCGTVINYDSEGHITDRVTKPADDPTWRPIVDLDAANQAHDPLTAFLMVRHLLRSNVDQTIKDTTVRVYDGKRLCDYTITAIQRTPILVGDDMVNAIHTVIKRKPIDGYTPKEWKKYNKGDPVIYAKFTDEENPVLINAQFDSSFGEITLERIESK